MPRELRPHRPRVPIALLGRARMSVTTSPRTVGRWNFYGEPISLGAQYLSGQGFATGPLIRFGVRHPKSSTRLCITVGGEAPKVPVFTFRSIGRTLLPRPE
jgi:hypothetical protein